MKKFTLLLSALLMVSFSALAQIKLVVCQEGGARSEFIASSVDSIIFVGLEDTPDVPVKPDDGDDDIDTPEVELPGEGKIRFIVDATAVGACYGLGIEGNFCGYNPDAAFKGTEFAENMFYIDMPSMTAVEFGNAKILLLDEDGSSDWFYQVLSYGYDIKGSEDYITIIDDLDGTQNAINLVADNIDNVVIKIKILEVHSIYHPCKPDVPAGPEDDEIVDPDKPINPDDDPVVPGTGGFVAKPFSVSATRTVTFSPGNLQYHAANDEWRFAPNQTDYIGEDNANISVTYNGWIDLFGWGTGNNPTNSTTDYDDYQTFVDWGVNKIGNYSPNTWRTLTYDEWDYIIYDRSNASNLNGVAQVNGVNGLILLPDAWQCPSGVTFKSGFHNNYGTEYYAAYQSFSASEWSKLEASGAVFLPAAGNRFGSFVGDVQGGGYYWSATEGSSGYAIVLGFGSDGAGVGLDYRIYGLSVRLVQD